MNNEARGNIINAAIQSGDDFTTAAVLNSPPWLSGLRPAELELRRGAWRRLRHGPALERLERLKRAAADTQRGGTALLMFREELYDRKVVETAEASEREAAEALAAVKA